MIVYKIQGYLNAASGYDNVQTFTPDYVWSVMKMPRRWWFPWPRIEVGVVTNLRLAERKALAMALHQARIRRKKDRTRIVRVAQLDGKETKTLIWDNGKTLDPSILPWYWRALRWLFEKEKSAWKTAE